MAGPFLAALAVLLAAAQPQALSAASPASVSAASAPLDYLPALRGDYFRLESKAVGRAFHIYVRYPEDYGKDPSRLYPVVYLLDGDSAFPILAPEHLFLSYDEHLPEAIVVGIAYGSFDPAVNRRDVDFHWPDAAIPPGKAGAPAFERFLETELIPAVERRYRADPRRRILVGQSFGGAFVLYSAFTAPDLFWGRIASNPGCAPECAFLYGRPARAARSDLGLVVTSGTRDHPGIRAEMLKWFAAWQGRRDAPWTLKAITIEGGTHAADLPNAYRAGMLWLFRDSLAPNSPPFQGGARGGSAKRRRDAEVER
ncbi:MAG TPA: alpha/beta hydrolase-fold protein [Allosphingosinicella sp.]